MRNAHGQTIWPAYFRRTPRVALEHEIIPTPDGDELALLHARGRPRGPTALLLHGLESSANAPWVHGLIAHLRPAGWNVTVMQFRSCGREALPSQRGYSAGDAGDLDTSIAHLRRGGCEYIYLVGFSLGGSVAASWLARNAGHAVVRGAAVVAAPFDLAASALKIDRTLGGLYSRYFLRTLRPKALELAGRLPGRIDAERVRRARTIVEFDDAATAPLFSYRDVWDYYQQCSCGPLLADIRVPTLLLASTDDPFNPAQTIPRAAVEASPWLIPQFTREGGHQGFVGGVTPWTPHFWAEAQVARFLNLCESAAQTKDGSGGGAARGV